MAIAIEKPVASSDTLTVDYWTVGEIRIRPKAYVTVEMHGYWTDADRKANKSPAATNALTAQIGAPAESSSDGSGSLAVLSAMPRIDTAIVHELLGQIYALVKGRAEYAGAVDC